VHQQQQQQKELKAAFLSWGGWFWGSAKRANAVQSLLCRHGLNNHVSRVVLDAAISVGD
jgi:hypothetical protein